MSELYEGDILLWSERQAALLLRRAAGELVNDADIDWPHVSEEIEDVGRSEPQQRGIAPGASIETTQGGGSHHRWRSGSTWRSSTARRCGECRT
jgi:hypothetical protein